MTIRSTSVQILETERHRKEAHIDFRLDETFSHEETLPDFFGLSPNGIECERL